MLLTSPSFFQHLLFEQPWPLVIALLAVAAILRVIARGNNLKKTNWLALGIALLAGAIIVLSYTVQTSREKLMAKTKTLVKATAPLDIKTLRISIEPNITLVTPNKKIIGKFKEFENAIKHYKISKQSVSNLGASVSGNKGVSKFTATTIFSSAKIPVRTKWKLIWRQDKNGKWQVSKIYWLKLNHHNPPSNIPKVGARPKPFT